MLIQPLNSANSTVKKTFAPIDYKQSTGQSSFSPKLSRLEKDTVTFTSKTVQTSLSQVERVQLNKDLDEIENKSIKYFIDNRSQGGLILDRAPNSDNYSWKKMSSIAATGYGLSALILGTEKSLISKKQAEEYTLQTLKFVDENTPEIQGGWLAHFMDGETGESIKFKDKDGNVTESSEISSIDTALFYFNAFASAEYFGGEVKKQVEKMYNKIDFKMMLTQDNQKPDQLAFNLGFHVKDGKKEFIPYKWDEYSEGILVPLFALGSKEVPETVWTKGWDRAKKWEYKGTKTFHHLPLFTYFYPHGLLDFKDKVDKNGDNFWEESKNAVKMQMDYCKDSGYPDGLFGITACDCPNDQYRADQPCDGANDGIIAPPAVIACLPFSEKEVSQRITTLKNLGLINNEKYGPCNAYNVKTGWRATDALGIDLGSMLLMIDYYKNNGQIHKLIEKNPIVKKSMDRAGFRKINSNLS
ncbi:MAG: hypothetical protein ACD_20C00056G0008 [uncultured bacterium]|nr:MAG: hypothetical protein ACD_20C00056G0008 [uncultured bacterium]